MTKSGIYLVQPAQSELKIIYNQKDAEGFIKISSNAHKIFKPADILDWDNSVNLFKFDYVDDNGIFHKDKNKDTENK